MNDITKSRPIILVDSWDRPIGLSEKETVHRKGLLHRAFSVFIFHGDTILLQKRAKGKYHCGGLWTNACCSHPVPDKDLASFAKTRLQEEMGFSCELSEAGSFLYRAAFSNGLTEYEFDHVLVGEYDGEVRFDPGEVQETAWVPIRELEERLLTQPDTFTPWFFEAYRIARHHSEQ